MKKSHFTEEQIVSVLKLVNSGMKVNDICEQHGICNATYYNWKSKYGDLSITSVNKLKKIEAENVRLKKKLAEISIENNAMKAIFEKKSW